MENVIAKLRMFIGESGLKKMVLLGEEMGWNFASIPLDQPKCALFRLLAYIDWLAFKCGFSGDTVMKYYSNTKSWYVENAPFLLGVTKGSTQI